jgi:hypothetical protein
VLQWKRGLFVFCLWLSTSFNFTAEAKINRPLPNNWQISESYEDKWLVYDTKYKGLCNYIPSRHSDIQTLSLNISYAESKNYKLYYWPEESEYLFINGNYYKTLNKNKWNSLTIEWLQKFKNKEGNILLSFYSEKVKLSPSACYLAINQSTESSKIFGTDQNPIKAKSSKNSLINFLSIILLVMLGYLVSMFNFQNKITNAYLDIKDLLTVKIRFDSNSGFRPLGIGNILFLVLYSSIVSIMIIIINAKYVNIINTDLQVVDNKGFFNYLIQFLGLTLAITLITIAKYLLMNILADFYKIKLVNLHFYKNIQAIYLVSVITILVLLTLSLNQNINLLISLNFLNAGIIFFFFLRSVFMFFIIYRIMNNNMFSIIAYLCIVELIPLFIGLRLIL